MIIYCYYYHYAVSPPILGVISQYYHGLADHTMSWQTIPWSGLSLESGTARERERERERESRPVAAVAGPAQISDDPIRDDPNQ